MFKALKQLISLSKNKDAYVKYEGNFDFYIRPVVQGQLPYHSSTITINCFKDKKSQRPIVFSVQWYREIGGKNYPIKDQDGPSYMVNPYDIGIVVVAAVKPIDPESNFKGVAIAKFGPIEMDYAISPLLENHFLSCEGAFNFKLLKFGDFFVHDQSDFSNKIFFERTKITLIFSGIQQGNGNFNDFCLDVVGTPGIRIKCDQHDSRIVRMFYQKGEEEPMTQSILKDERGYVNRFEKSVGSSIWEEYSYNNDDTLKESSEQRLSIASDNFHMILESNESDFNLEDMTELALKFESRVLRDCFLVSLRVMRLIRNIPFNKIVENFNKIISKMWYPNNSDQRSPEYIQACFVLESHKEILRRMLRINKSLVLENDNLNENVDILENDLEFSAREFSGLIMQLKKQGETVNRLDTVKNKLIKHSEKIDEIRGRSKTPSKMKKGQFSKKNLTEKEQKKFKRLEKQLESRKTLNKMLLVEIEKLKHENKKQKERKKSVLDMTLNEPRQSRMERKRVNRSVLDGVAQENDYLMNLEKNLKDKNEVYTKRINEAQEKIEHFEKQEQERLKEIREENDILKRRLEIHDDMVNQMLNIVTKIQNGEEIEYIDEVNQAVAEITSGEIKSIADLKLKRLYQYSTFVNKKLEDIDSKVNFLEELEHNEEENKEKLAEEINQLEKNVEQKEIELVKVEERGGELKDRMKEMERKIKDIIQKRKNHKYEGMTYEEKIELMQKKVDKLETKNKELKDKREKRLEANRYKVELGNKSLSLSSEGDLEENVLNKESKEEEPLAVVQGNGVEGNIGDNPFLDEGDEQEDNGAQDFNPFNPFGDALEEGDDQNEDIGNFFDEDEEQDAGDVKEKATGDDFNPFNPFADDDEEEDQGKGQELSLSMSDDGL